MARVKPTASLSGLVLSLLAATPWLSLLPTPLPTPLMEGALARPMGGGGLGGPRSGAGVRPGAGFGAPGAGMRPGAGAGAPGAGVRPGVGWGAPGAGLTRAPGASAWNPAWARRGYWPARTWSAGWYRPYPAAWPWWRTSSGAWGVTSLATAAAITSAVDAAADQQSTVIVVPQTSLQLDYGSIQPLPPNGVQFAVSAAGMPYATVTSDCKQGLINGAPPTTADQAQLLNASCQIAYGSV